MKEGNQAGNKIYENVKYRPILKLNLSVEN